MEDPRARERMYRRIIAFAVIEMCREAAGRYWEQQSITFDEVTDVNTK